MVDFTVLAAFIPASLVIILSPGADTFLLLRFAVRGGRRAGFLAMIGILLGLSAGVVSAAHGKYTTPLSTHFFA